MPSSYHAEYAGTHSLDDLGAGKVLHAFGHVWRPTMDETRSLRLAHFLDPEVGRRAFVTKLKEMEYRSPKWWEFWRWNEHKPAGWE